MLTSNAESPRREKPVAPLVGLVLVGGQSRRMGAPKWALDYHGETQAAVTARLLGSVCERVVLSVAPGPVPAGLTDLPVVADDGTARGPSAGILAAFAAFPATAFLVLAVDLPLLDAPTLAALVAGRDPARLATAFLSPCDGSPRGGSPEPLCAVWEPSATAPLLAAVRAGATCPRRFLLDHLSASGGVCLLDAPDARALANANTPADRDAIQTLLAARAEASTRPSSIDPPPVRSPIRIHLAHFSLFRDARGRDAETVTTDAATPRDLYDRLGLGAAHPDPETWARVAVNDGFAAWDARLADGDTVVFLAPAAGG